MKSKTFLILLLFTGSILFIIGAYNLYLLYDKSGKMEHTTGVVTHLTTEKTYRHRKIYYKRTALIQYGEDLHKDHVSRQLYNPFIFQGSEIALWYSPDHTEEAVIPSEEGFKWGSIWILGGLCLFAGITIIKTKKYEH